MKLEELLFELKDIQQKSQGSIDYELIHLLIIYQLLRFLNNSKINDAVDAVLTEKE